MTVWRGNSSKNRLILAKTMCNVPEIWNHAFNDSSDAFAKWPPHTAASNVSLKHHDACSLFPLLENSSLPSFVLFIGGSVNFPLVNRREKLRDCYETPCAVVHWFQLTQSGVTAAVMSASLPWQDGTFLERFGWCEALTANSFKGQKVCVTVGEWTDQRYRSSFRARGFLLSM